MLITTNVNPVIRSFRWSTVLIAAFATFTTYFCMYGFRKAISAATFDGQMALGISFKSALIIAQVVGYMVAKFAGIKLIAELDPANRTKHILVLLGSAHLSLLLLAIVPSPFNVFFMFMNGLSLGLIWGFVFSYIEGRKFTDLLALILSTNFIFSSGIAKSLGRFSIENWNVQEIYMPFIVGLIYVPLLLLAVWMLKKIPPPTNEEKMSRGARTPLNGKERIALLSNYLLGLLAITGLNLLLTILRDVKDNYAVEILRSLKPGFNPAIFAQMETVAALSVLGLLLLLTGFKNHYKSILAHHMAIAAGLVIVLLAAWFLRQGIADPVINLVLYTIGLYICYNTLQCLFIDRFISSFKIKGNTGFLFYFMDAIGYLGSCFIIFNKELFNAHTNWLNYFLQVSFILGIAGLACIIISWCYITYKYKSAHP